MRPVPIPRPRAMHAAPFYSRAYGGFSRAQAQFISELIPDPSGLKMGDPMCGQALLAGSWAHAGAHVSIADVNPGPLALAALRSPSLVSRRTILGKQLADCLKAFAGSKTTAVGDQLDPQEESDDWLRASVQRDLALLGDFIGLRDTRDLAKAFRERDPFRRFAMGICALAARQLTTFRLSDNVTWLRPGGLGASTTLDSAMLEALNEWIVWAGRIRLNRPLGSLRLSLSPVQCWEEDALDYIVTSPPYANRLDYKRMWAPETSVVRALVQRQIDDVGPFIGTNKVEDIDQQQLKQLPRSVRVALDSIRNNPAWGSTWYYYPFFAKYAVDLDVACKRMAKLLRRKGAAIIFGRDTIRKDTLFPTVDVVLHAMRSGSCDLVRREGSIIRSHIGNMRVSHDIGLYGKAQREWWLVFRKR